MVRDITAQKAAEQEISRLLSRERLLSRLPEALPVGLFEIDMAGHVTFTNDRMYTIAGQVPAATMEGLMPSVVAEDRPVLESALGAVLADQPVDDLYLEPQRIGERVGDQRFRQSMSFAVRSRATARAS